MKFTITLTKEELFAAIVNYIQPYSEVNSNWKVNTEDTFVSSSFENSTICLYTQEPNNDQLQEPTQETQTKPLNPDDKICF